jgi:nucleoside-diphosphate-sugar epimerase
MQNDAAARPVLLVTGSSGLIGSLVVKEFDRDFTVVGVDLKPPREGAGGDFIRCDLTSDEDTARAFAEVRRKHGDRLASVIHLAAYYDFSGEPSPLYQQLTVDGTRRLLRELNRFERVDQFVFTSTLLVMEPAEEEDEVITETSPVEDEPWDYPRSKMETEKVLRDEHGAISTVVLRIAGVYDESGNSIPISQHIARIHQKQLESYFFPGDPDHGTPYIHLDDLMACFRRVVELRSELGNYAVFLIAEPDFMSYEELQESIGELVHGKEWPTIRIPKTAAKVGAWGREKVGGDDETFIKPWMVDLADAHYPVAVEHAEEELGWRARQRLRNTLPEIVRGLKKNPKRFYEENGLPLPDELQEGPGRKESATEASEREQAKEGGAEAEEDVEGTVARTGADDDLHAHPPNLDYNPSAWSQRIPLCLLAGVAFVISTYLALYQWRLIGSVWDPVFGGQSAEVLDSDASESMRGWMRIPDAALGSIAYLGDAIFGLAGSTRRWQYRPWMVILFGIDVIPLGIVSAILVATQGLVVGAWCFLCLVTAVISLILILFAYDEVWTTLLYLRRVWRRTRDWGALWKVFWGTRVAAADEVALRA